MYRHRALQRQYLDCHCYCTDIDIVVCCVTSKLQLQVSYYYIELQPPLMGHGVFGVEEVNVPLFLP